MNFKIFASKIGGQFAPARSGQLHRRLQNNEDLLLEKSEKGKRRKFNFIEYSWIRIIHELRKFEIGFTIIRKL